MSSVRVALEDPRSEAAMTLVGELTKELGALYPEPVYGGGSGSFKPDDVLVPRAAFVVAWDGDTPVGCGAIRPMADANVAEVKRMYVRPAMRGKGISRLILSALEQHARDYGYQRALLETGKRQLEAMRLYETSGYQTTDCYGQYADAPQSICYEKAL